MQTHSEVQRKYEKTFTDKALTELADTFRETGQVRMHQDMPHRQDQDIKVTGKDRVT